MIEAKVLAQLCVDLYDDTKESTWVNYWKQNDIVVAHQKIDDVDILVFRGSIDTIDWIRDGEGWPTFDKQLGFVHNGFLSHMRDVLKEVDPGTSNNVVITGHSLGGARARVMAALMAVNHIPVKQLTVFGSPKPAFANLRRIIEKSGMIHTSYRNRNDPVPMVPGIIPLWEHTEPFFILNEAADQDNLDPLRDHHINLYLRGVS